VLELPTLLALRGESDLRFDGVVGRNALASSPDPAAAAAAIRALLAPGGRLSLAETVTRRAPRPSSLATDAGLDDDLMTRWRQAEASATATDPRQAWDLPDLEGWLRAAGLRDLRTEAAIDAAELTVTPALVERWFGAGAAYAAALGAELSAAEVDRARAAVATRLGGPAAPWPTVTAYVTARA
jgi:hypothetical protein